MKCLPKIIPWARRHWLYCLALLCLWSDPDTYPKNDRLLTSVRASYVVGYVSGLSEGAVSQANEEEFLIGPFDKLQAPLQSHCKISIVGRVCSIA